ncbi:hypothetical protein BCF55_0435 [Hydrogenivirga caldilitoris]|uniref:Outer membrane protein with beta-barrel domain n=1 Tax=Hydrogenivirga caldilitoris TaxID=246264 RepID=A0A497XPH2_9AQUI|nr:hypothetical protein [Hydrogenivirga caldilitoris]RLJ70171.1 hypothetical protein BCF55_0435 [Hydrogenivirga caldilitoris]
MLIKIALLLIIFFSLSYSVELRVQAFGGVVYNLPTPLLIKQAGYEEIDLTARYETRPFETSPAPYYVVRGGVWEGGKAWEIELIHSKLYLKNKPAEVQEFQITYGYNYLLLNRAWETGSFIWRVGGGVVITHPSSVVRGKENEYVRYDISGVGIQVGVERVLLRGRNFIVSVEAKLSSAYAEVPIAAGYAVVPNLAVHGILGIGFGF